MTEGNIEAMTLRDMLERGERVTVVDVQGRGPRRVVDTRQRARRRLRCPERRRRWGHGGA